MKDSRGRGCLAAPRPGGTSGSASEPGVSTVVVARHHGLTFENIARANQVSSSREKISHARGKKVSLIPCFLRSERWWREWSHVGREKAGDYYVISPAGRKDEMMLRRETKADRGQ